MAFKPRSRTTFGIPPKKPASEVCLDTRSFVRQAPLKLRDKPCSTVQQRLWMDITNLDTTNLEKTDEEYDSNMWKNLKFVRSNVSAGSLARTTSRASSKKAELPRAVEPKVEEDKRIRGMVADIYPLRIPKASTIGDNTYNKFLNEAKLRDKKRNTIERQFGRTQEFQGKVLRIKSECRAPPINVEGEIIPPDDFKKYPQMVMEEDSWFYQKPLSYVAQTSRPYTGSPSSVFRYGTPWKRGLTGKGSYP
ncbi:uncharacterized protein LOC116306581 [Actinia tenebrosa]|uniref:Uncharacterized protein LOC116306581 n=1 Tax=Actinia tenebrosa TaxID=6105 RepID=A0A6P8IZ96_ACTTE|nr:uncharacterized protein LOC116306581 [Actinia tenebrosa]